MSPHRQQALAAILRVPPRHQSHSALSCFILSCFTLSCFTPIRANPSPTIDDVEASPVRIATAHVKQKPGYLRSQARWNGFILIQARVTTRHDSRCESGEVRHYTNHDVHKSADFTAVAVLLNDTAAVRASVPAVPEQALPSSP